MITFHPSCGRFIYLKLLKLVREPATVTCEWHRSGLNLEVEKASTTIIARKINASHRSSVNETYRGRLTCVREQAINSNISIRPIVNTRHHLSALHTPTRAWILVECISLRHDIPDKAELRSRILHLFYIEHWIHRECITLKILHVGHRKELDKLNCRVNLWGIILKKFNNLIDTSQMNGMRRINTDWLADKMRPFF